MTRKLYSVNGRELTLQQWGEELGVKWKTLWARINKGIPLDQAISKEFTKKTPQRDMSKVIEKVCEWCEKPFLIPKCRDWREKSCSSDCKDKARAGKTEKLKESRTRSCALCGGSFIVKLSQIKAMQGSFCSLKCSFDGQVRKFIHSPSAREKALNTFKEGIRTGRNVRQSGASHPKWMGGPAATRKRRTESGKAAATLRRYRKENPHRVREFSMTRKDKMGKSLPKGTIQRIGDAQRWKCAICYVHVKNGYHADHIMPLKLGGEHEPGNIQILCQTCNVRKNAKHPIQYMQERGFLL